LELWVEWCGRLLWQRYAKKVVHKHEGCKQKSKKSLVRNTNYDLVADVTPIVGQCDLLTRSELAARWRISRRTVQRMQRTKTIRAVRIGRQVRFRRADIEAFEQAHFES